MPTRYMGSAFKLGQTIGAEAGAGAAKAVALKQIGSELTFDRQMTFELLKGGEGFTRNLDGSFNNPDYADSPEKIMLGQRGYLDTAVQAYKDRLDGTAKAVGITNNLWKSIDAAIKEPDPKTKRQMINNYVSLAYDVMPLTAKKINLKQYADKILLEEDVKSVRKKIQIDSLISAREDFTRTRDTNFLHDYTLAYMSDPETAKGLNFPMPENLEKQYISQETNKIEQDREKKEKEQAARMPTGDVGQFYQVMGRKPKDIQELAAFRKQIRPQTYESDRKKANIRKAYPGLDEETVNKLAVGTIKVVRDPITDQWTMVDVGTQTEIPMKRVGEELLPKPVTPKQTLWELSDLVTGPVSAARAGASVPSGIVGAPIAEKTVRARQYIRAAQNDLIRSLSINPRFPVAEMNRIKNEINISPGILDNPKMLRARMRAVNDYLSLRLAKEVMTANDKEMPKAQRQAAKQATRDIGMFLKILGVPQERKELKIGDIEDGYRYKGGDPSNSENWKKVK